MYIGRISIRYVPDTDTPPFRRIRATLVRTSVAWVLAMDEPRLDLQPRLTAVAASDLAALHASLAIIELDPSSDDVRFVRGAPSVRYSTAIGYSLTFSHLPDDAFSPLIWNNLAPSR